MQLFLCMHSQLNTDQTISVGPCADKPPKHPTECKLFSPDNQAC